MKVQKLKKKLALTICMIAVFIAMTGTAKAQPTVISVQPSHLDVPAPGETFELNVTIADSPAIVQWTIRVQYNPSVLAPILANETTQEPLIDKGDFLSQGGTYSTALMPKPMTQANKTAGVIYEITEIFLDLDELGPSGSGWLCTLHFNATASGTSDVTIYESYLLDKDGVFQDSTQQKGTVTVIPEFPAALILPLFLITTAIIVGVSKIAWTKRRRGYVDVP